MKNLTVLAVLCVATAGLTGCIDNTSPKGTLTSAAYSLKKGNTQEYQRLLSGPAREKFGTPEGMAALKQKLQPHNSFSFGREAILQSQYGYQGHGYYGDILRVYQIEVLGETSQAKGVHVMTAQVTCEVYVRAQRYLGGCNNNQGGIGNCGTYYGETEACVITDLTDLI